MICYLDRTFCIAPGCTCGRALTDEIRKRAEELGLPISVARLCAGSEAA